MRRCRRVKYSGSFSLVPGAPLAASVSVWAGRERLVSTPAPAAKRRAPPNRPRRVPADGGATVGVQVSPATVDAVVERQRRVGSVVSAATRWQRCVDGDGDGDGSASGDSAAVK